MSFISVKDVLSRIESSFGTIPDTEDGSKRIFSRPYLKLNTYQRFLPVLIAAILFAPFLGVALPVEAQQQSYSKVVPASAETRTGLFDVHQVDGKLLFEIPDFMLGRDMIIMSRYDKTQERFADVGARMSPNITVRWDRREDRILLRGVSASMTADPADRVSLAVEKSAFPSVIHAFPILARGNGTSVVDVTDIYLDDHPAFSLPQRQRSQYNVRKYDRNRSWIEFAKSFPINVEVRVVRTYAADQPPSAARGGAISFEVNHSMVLLPEEPMMPRLADERMALIYTGTIGFTEETTNYSRDFQGVRPERYVVRYRMEPSDPEAWARGELVEPVRPLVWYIDPATPEEWIPYYIAGIEEWNEAFELAGFKNAVRARLAPTPEEDPNFSLLDARYSVIRYVPTMVRSANAGGDVVDPRSGEVIRAHMNMFQGIDERLRWWMVSQLAAANPAFRTKRMSEADLGEAIRFTISHEMAHAVGLEHNQRANFAFPLESIRDSEFVKRMGHSASSVGRTRYNYAAQQEDNVPPERRIGIWDKFAVKWAYRPIPEASTPQEELETLNQWIVERAHLPWFRSTMEQYGMDNEWDPYRMTEGISDDPVGAAELGMRNLRYATENLLDWVLEPGDDYYELETHYLQMLTQWNRFAEHAASAVGGSWTHMKRYGEEGWIYTPVEREYQQKAMRFLDDHVLQTPTWALSLDLLRRLEHAGAVERIRAYQELAVQRLLNHARLARMIEYEAFHGGETYRPSEMLDDAREMIWREVRNGATVDTYRRNMQRAWLDQAHYLLHKAESRHWDPPASGNLRVSSNNDPPLRADLHIGQSDIRPLIRDQLRLLRGEIERALARKTSDRMTRIHLEDALVRISSALKETEPR